MNMQYPALVMIYSRRDVPTATRIAQVGRDKIYELIADKRIKAKKLDGKTMVVVESLLNYIDSLPDAGGAE